MDKYDKAWLHIEQYLEHGGADPAAILRESFPDPTEDSLTEERALAGDWARHDIGEIVNALEHAIDAYDALRAQLAEVQAEIDLTYKEWCGRDLMHLPLHEAVGEAIKAAEGQAEASGELDVNPLDAIQGTAEEAGKEGQV